MFNKNNKEVLLTKKESEEIKSLVFTKDKISSEIEIRKVAVYAISEKINSFGKVISYHHKIKNMNSYEYDLSGDIVKVIKKK